MLLALRSLYEESGTTATVAMSAPSPVVAVVTAAALAVSVAMIAAPPSMAVATSASAPTTIAASGAAPAVAVATGAAAPASVALASSGPALAAEATCSASAGVACASTAPRLSVATGASAVLSVAAVGHGVELACVTGAATAITVAATCAAPTLQAYDERGGAPPYALLVGPSPRRALLVGASPARSCVVAAAVPRALSVAAVEPRTVVVWAAAARTLLVFLRGVPLVDSAVFYSDNDPIDVQLEADGAPVSVVGALAIEGLITYERATDPVPLAFVVLDASLGTLRHVRAPGAIPKGLHSYRVRVTFADGSIRTYPDLNHNPKSLRVGSP